MIRKEKKMQNRQVVEENITKKKKGNFESGQIPCLIQEVIEKCM